MWLKYSLPILLLVIAWNVSCQNTNVPDPSSSRSLQVVSNSVTNLAQKISLAIANQKSKTEIFSPVSIAGALSLLLLGSGGSTKEELMKLMGFRSDEISFTEIHKSFGKLFRELVSNEPTLQANVPWRENDKCNNLDDEDYEMRGGFQNDRQRRDADSHLISVANGVFLSQDLQVSNNYSNLSKNLYGAKIQRLNFAGNPQESASVINQWVRTATRGKIREIVTQDQVSGIPMVLASALYFKAKWETMFIAQNTKSKPFYLNGQNQPPVEIDTMATSGCFPYYDAKEIDAKIVGFPYQEQQSTMYIVLPNESDRGKLQNLQRTLSMQQFNRMIDQMQTKSGSILMPKMKIENSIKLKMILEALGLHRIFDPAVSNLTKITHWESPNQAARKPPTPTRRATVSTTSTRPLVYPTETSTEVSAPIVPSTNPSIKYPVSAEECHLINNCNFDGKTCNCALNQRVAVNQLGCHQKPFYVARQCQSNSVVTSAEGSSMCIVDTYTKNYNNRDQCIQSNCYYISDQCYCCKATPVQPTQQIPQQPQPTQPEEQVSFSVSNRYNPAENAFTQCQTFQHCDQYQRCAIYKACPLLNSPQMEGPRRTKRQARQLYVHEIAHKVSLDINEEGTEGGAATAVVVDRITSSFTLRVEAPFLLYIRHDVTKLPLFYGPVYDPRP